MNQDWQNSYFLALFGAATLHGLYLSSILLAKSEKGSGKLWLSLTLLGISALLINYLVYTSGAVVDYPHLLNVFIPLTFLTGPSFYFFIRKTQNKGFSLRWFHLVHLIPILWLLWETAIIVQWPVEQKLAAINAILETPQPTFLEVLLGNRFSLTTAFYVMAALFYLSREQGKPATKHLNRLNWLKKFSITFLSLLMASVVLPFGLMMLSVSGAYIELILTLIYAVAVHILGYFILKNHKGTPWVSAQGKYQTSPLNATLLNGYKSKILSHLQAHQPWLNPDFSIGDLSTQVSIPKHHLSQVLNEEINMSFVDLINSYRVEAAIAKLTSGALEKYSVMGIAMDCGFTSKSTFNRTFKKFTGVTPTAYLAQESASNSALKRVG